ncbi:MAG: hypothetical protein ACPGXZ_01910 [Saprospiraceae bacterium]
MSRYNRKTPKQYAIELIILVFGITVSFLLNEWRENIQHRRIEQQTLLTIQENLAADTLMLSQQDLVFDMFIGRLEKLLDEDKSSYADSLDFYLDASISYGAFFETTIGYNEMTQTGNSQHIRDRKLLQSIIRYYTKSLVFLKEWTKIDEQFVLNRSIPHFESTFPHAPLYKYGELYAKKSTRLQRALNQDEFKNIVRDNILFKKSSQQVFKFSKKNAIDLMKEIEAYQE